MVTFVVIVIAVSQEWWWPLAVLGIPAVFLAAGIVVAVLLAWFFLFIVRNVVHGGSPLAVAVQLILVVLGIAIGLPIAVALSRKLYEMLVANGVI